MKAITSVIAVTALAGAAVASTGYSQILKPGEVTLGYVNFTGDVHDFDGITGGWVAGYDYHINQFGPGSTGFVGVRYWSGTGNGETASAFGAHYGVKFGMNSMGGKSNPMGGVYFKIAGGYYSGRNTDAVPTTKWGFGGFAGIGYEIQNGFSIEGGYQIGPSWDGLNNTSWYIGGTYRM